jgi:uncharacterized membrane protein
MTQEIEIGNYLSTLRSHLGPLTLAEREEIVREIVAHIRDSAEQSGAGVSAILARLGPADQLAAQYRDGMLIRQASASFSPLVLLRASLRLATTGISGILVFFLGLFGYAFGAGMVLSAIIKPFQPANTGVWFTETRTINSGVIYPMPGPHSHELLGWWFIPIMLTLGSLTLLATTYTIKKFLGVSHRLVARMLT